MELIVKIVLTIVQHVTIMETQIQTDVYAHWQIVLHVILQLYVLHVTTDMVLLTTNVPNVMKITVSNVTVKSLPVESAPLDII